MYRCLQNARNTFRCSGVTTRFGKTRRSDQAQGRCSIQIKSGFENLRADIRAADPGRDRCRHLRRRGISDLAGSSRLHGKQGALSGLQPADRHQRRLHGLSHGLGRISNSGSIRRHPHPGRHGWHVHDAGKREYIVGHRGAIQRGAAFERHTAFRSGRRPGSCRRRMVDVQN